MESHAAPLHPRRDERDAGYIQSPGRVKGNHDSASAGAKRGNGELGNGGGWGGVRIASPRRAGSGDADFATMHFDRDVSTVEGHWRAVRQPWGHQFSGLPVGSSNEPIGPGSSVAAENDSVKLVAPALVTYISGLPMYVFHSKAGIRGYEELADMPGVDRFVALKRVAPNDVASWTPKNAHWPDSPFRVYARDGAGKLITDTRWPDHEGGSGAVRVYAAVNGAQFFVAAIGVRGTLTMEPRRAAQFDVIDPMTGDVLHRKRMEVGERFELKEREVFVLSGRMRIGP